MIDLSRYQRAFQALPAGIRRAEVNAERIRRTTVHIRKGSAESSEAYDQTKYYVRAGRDRLGLVYTEKPDEDAAEVLRRAAENAEWAGRGPASPMNGPELSRQERQSGSEPTVSGMIALGAAVEKRLARADILDLSVTATTREMHTVNTLGLDTGLETRWVELYAMISLPRKGMQPSVTETNMSAAAWQELSPDAFASKALRQAESYDGGGLPPMTVVGGKQDCVMTGQVMRNILMTAWRAFSLEAMQSGGSCFKSAGETVGSPAVKLVNAPSHALSGKCWPVDSEGTPMAETVVVESGRLVHPLTTLVSASKAGLRSGGCAGRVPCMTGNVPIALTTVPGMFYLSPEAGVTQESLIRRMKTGLVLTYSLDLFHSVSIASGAFSVPCGGYYVKDGVPVGSVSQMTVAGTLRELFSGVEAVADDLDFDDFYFKNYCVGSPSALMRGLVFAS